MLRRLSAGPASVSELAAPFRMSRMAASKHLKVLEAAGLVTRRIDGRVHHCSLASTPLVSIDRWLDHYRARWNSNLESLAGYIERGVRTESKPNSEAKRERSNNP